MDLTIVILVLLVVSPLLLLVKLFEKFLIEEERKFNNKCKGGCCEKCKKDTKDDI